MDYPKFATLVGLHFIASGDVHDLFVETGKNDVGFFAKCWGCGFDEDVTYENNLTAVAQEHASACTGLGVDE